MEKGDQKKSMEKQLSFGNLIAHLVPGVVALLILLPNGQSNLPDWLTKNSISLATAFLSVALAVGLLLDSARYLLVRLICLIPSIACLHKYERFPATGKLEEYNWIIENYYRHHQFCGNLTLASILLFRLTPEKLPTLLPIILILILGLSAIFMYQRTTVVLNKAFPKNP